MPRYWRVRPADRLTIGDQPRHQLYHRLEELLGVGEAATLMEHLPPVGWPDVATKGDLDHLAAARADTASVRAEVHEEVGKLGESFGGRTRPSASASRGCR